MSRQSVAKGPTERSGTVLGKPMYRNRVSQYGEGLPFPQGSKEGPLKKVPRSYFPDAGGEGPPAVYGAAGDGRYPRQHVSAQVRSAGWNGRKSVPCPYPAPGILGRAGHAGCCFRTVPNPDLRQRPGDQDGSTRVRHSDGSSRKTEACTEQTTSTQAGLQQKKTPGNFQNGLLRGRSAGSSPKGSSPVNANHAASIYLTIVAEEGVHQHAVRGHAGVESARQRRTTLLPDGVPLGPVEPSADTSENGYAPSYGPGRTRRPTSS